LLGGGSSSQPRIGPLIDLYFAVLSIGIAAARGRSDVTDLARRGT